MADHGDGGGSGEVVDRSEDQGGMMVAEMGDETVAETVGVSSAAAESGGDGVQEQQQETAGDEVPRAAESETRARDQIGAVGVSGEPEVSGMVAEGLPVVGGSSGGIIGSGAGEDDTGPSQTPPRDSAKGKGAVIAEEQVEEAQPEREQTIEADPVEVREEDIAFRPPAGAATSSRHVPITFDEIAEHTPDAILARLLEERPDIGEYVLKAKEDRARAVEAAARAEREAEGERAGSEGLAADVEAEEAEAEEALGPRVSAVAEAGALERPEFSEEAYTPPRPHLFVPLGFAGYRPPQQTDYDPELILRDPGVHIANTWAEAEQRDIRGFGGPCSSLALYIGLPARVRELVDVAGFREFIQTLTVPVRNDHAVLVALAERWRDTSNTFHLPPGEMTRTPSDFAAITGLRVGGEPIPFDSGIHADPAALEWFLGEVPQVERGAARYAQFIRYLKKKPANEHEEAQMARAYLLYMFGASLFPGRGSTIHLSYLPALRDLRTASRFDWGGAALGTAYQFFGDASRNGQSMAGYWRVWELWAIVHIACLSLYAGRVESLEDERARARVLGTEQGSHSQQGATGVGLWLAMVLRGSSGPPVTRSSGVSSTRATPTTSFPYTLAELERFTRPDTELVRHLRPTMDYAAYQRDRLARPLGVRARREIQEQAREAGAEMRAAAEALRGGERRVRRRESRPVVGGPPELVWKVPAEWVNEALRRMLALENLVRRAAQGMPLQLRYPAPTAQPAQAAASRRTQAQGRAASRKRARSPPQQAATGTTTRPVVTRRQTRSSQPVAASKEAAKKAVARAEERYRIEMREVRGREEPVRKRLVVPDPVEDEEEGDEESKSDSDDTVDDPRYLQNPHELAAADEDDSDDDNGGDDVEEDLRDTDWLGRDEDD
ncbi:hypothetical protein RHMOL_Rhmol09G0099800 [Rhododendron molle]|uniref:Uncharacterized protein n=1 Tax=Rhododendron molle TaxID=49168 RepID=A0ACC0MCC7_RHOML|nr:hypothetical protein RHMOL_Rhmol09G0099800 [Rhododendron molle]